MYTPWMKSDWCNVQRHDSWHKYGVKLVDAGPRKGERVLDGAGVSHSELHDIVVAAQWLLTVRRRVANQSCRVAIGETGLTLTGWLG
jgi:hypothetical protein